MNFPERFQQHLKDNFQLSLQARFLLAVSGGIDSVVLTDLVYKSGFDFVIAHCNFQLRGEESERDEIFVRSLGEKYSKAVFIKKFDTEKYAEKNKISIQEAARNLRYEWFGEMINSQRPIVNSDTPLTHHSPLTTHILTAHHADDNIETLLMHFFRGTGIHGLTAIPPIDKKRKIIRPLLFAGKEEILSYAKENDLQWMEDSSNISDKYTRNFFRNALLPAISEIFPNVRENLFENIQRFNEAEILYQQAIKMHKKRLLEQRGNEIHIPILKLLKSSPVETILWEIIKPYQFTSSQVHEVMKLMHAENAGYVSSSSFRVIKNRKWLIIAPNAAREAEHILMEEYSKHLEYSAGYLEFKQQEAENYKPQTSNIATLDTAEIKFPLMLRKWKQGDYFYPLGMHKKKKLARFFIDLKLSKTEKEKVWVLETNKKIIWVIGYRIDDRFKITASTKDILKISFSPKTYKISPGQ